MQKNTSDLGTRTLKTIPLPPSVSGDSDNVINSSDHCEKTDTLERGFKSLFDHSIDSIMVLNSETGNIIDFNIEASRCLGYASREFRQLKLHDIELNGSPADTTHLLEKVRKDGHAVYETKHRSKSGEVRDSLVWSWIIDFNGNNVIVYKYQDITEKKRIETALEKSNLWLNNIYNSLEEAVFVVTPDRILKNVNDAAEEIFGYSREELFELSTEILHVDHEHYLEFGKKIMSSFEMNRTAHFEFRAKRKNGEIFPSEHTVSLLKDGEGRSLGIVSVVRDISERRKAEEDIATLASIVESSDDAIIGKLLDGTVVSWNPAAERMYGYIEHEMVGNQISVLVPEDRPDEFPGILHKISQGTPVEHFETVRVKKNGNLVDVSLTVSPIRDSDNNLIGASTIARDITDRKRTEKELELSFRFLNIANQNLDIQSLLGIYLKEICELTRCSAVGIRILDDQGNIPFQAYHGYSKSFYDLESPLSIHTHQCMCIRVIKGETDPDLTCFTPNGSFYINGTTRFLASVPMQKKGATRNICNKHGYESVALVPIRLGDRILGLIHIADCREDAIHLSTIELLEKLSMQIASAFQRAWSEEELRKSKDTLEKTVIARTEALQQSYIRLKEESIKIKQTEDALKESTQLLQDFMDSATEGFSLWDAELNLITTNRISLQWFNAGPDVSALVGRNILTLIPDVKKSGRYDLYQKVMQTGEPIYIDDIKPHARLGDRRFSLRAFKVGRGIGMIIADVTERRKAEEELKIYERIISTTKSFMSFIDSNFIYRAVNDTYLNTLHICRDRIIGYHVSDIIGKETYENSVRKKFEQCLKGYEVHYQWWLSVPSGDKRCIESCLYPYYSEEKVISGIVVNAYDITDRKSAEEKLRLSSKELSAQKEALEKKNIALREVIEQIDIEKVRLKEDIAENIENTILPLVSKVKFRKGYEKFGDALMAHLDDLTSSFGKRIANKNSKLTQKEIEICSMIKSGLSSKEICNLLNISDQTVEKHRKNIRKKLGISNKKINLFSYLHNM